MITRVDHIGIAVHSIEEAREPYEAIGLTVTRIMDVASRPLKVAFLPIGDTELELLEPFLHPSSMHGVRIEFVEKQ
ncbi:MAG: hypothetical protein P8186_03200 [Anaerolineae bacterium]